jgi:hypothetical protein
MQIRQCTQDGEFLESELGMDPFMREARKAGIALGEPQGGLVRWLMECGDLASDAGDSDF